MAKKVLFINLDGKVVNSTVILSDNITVDYSTIYADGNKYTRYNGFIYLIQATEEEIEKEMIKSIREQSFFANMESKNQEKEIINPDLSSYNVGLKEVVDFNKELLIKKFSLECNSTIQNGFYSNSLDAFFSFDEKDQANFNQKLSLKLLIPTDESNVMWKSEDKGILNLTKQQFINLVNEASIHKENNIGRFWQAKSIIYNGYNVLQDLETLKNKSLDEVLQTQ